jgi:hypothetical protein
VKLRRTILALIAGIGLSACATTSVPKSNVPSLHSLRHSLLTIPDFPNGWTVSSQVSETGSLYPCTAVKSQSHLLGSNAVGIAFTQRTERSWSFEYLAYRKAILTAFENASTKVGYLDSCREEGYGVVIDASVNTGLIETRTFGDWSLLLGVANVVRGTKYQVGYMLVRKGKYMLVIGYDNVGSLNVNALENLTTEALAKIPTK